LWLAVGGRLLEALPPTPLAPGALGRALDRLEAPGDAPPGVGGGGGVPAEEPSPDAGELPPPALRALLRGARPRWLAPGLRQAVLLRGPGGTLRLLRVRPGTALPRHGHGGAELTVVVEGAFADETGRYGPGDLAEADEGVEHRPVAEGPSDCVCLVASRGRLRFGGPVGWLLGALVR
jgi:putative transcriptional regulator